MPKIISVTDMVNNFSELAESLESNQPVFITKNGKGAYAIMSMEAYDTLAESQAECGEISPQELAEICRKIAEAEESFKNGDTLTLDELKASVRSSYDKI